MKIIDLRSDTVTRPTREMRSIMADAEVGDDVYGEDPTVNRLESIAAELLGMEAALFVGSGTLGNLLALLAHCERGDEYIAGQTAHVYRWEGGGAAVFGGIQPQPLPFQPDGTLDLKEVENSIKPDDSHYARTRLLCLENTQEGKPLPLSYLEQASELARRRSLGIHLDGARIFNAAVALEVPAAEIARHFDTVSFCLSKGLGAPVGSLLCGKQEIVARARRWRKVAGGGMRQAGILAAAGIYALERNIGRLAEDHENARLLSEELQGIEGLDVSPARTNMAFLSMKPYDAEALHHHLRKAGILIREGERVRLVTHLDVTREDVERVKAAVAGYFRTKRAAAAEP
ncbi:low-specificity L-threonine aldolase [Geobacter sp. DSM 9736]|uniref:low-specificity L-threonine aldolase n=1 Tax=Geobacter sp. DSM 9736 TaxID=1277350 RepID=UPI000B508ADB|nr:L-threonine aldolase [Geobacter sp. DSM 9736]